MGVVLFIGVAFLLDGSGMIFGLGDSQVISRSPDNICTESGLKLPKFDEKVDREVC